ncbi:MULTISPECIES: enoyl-CoA hydratase family protein [Prauserella salsuginis group]|uniref:Methylglutaconyl-CoA hydratase n=2 Tax=Prauserella salsuginis group TaxID=2893672 RepID=A0A839XXH8_9PSEU|nr:MULTISPECIES: enoyl-CoA hydratase family protein [Prauserella salsuginis group]MBB3666064.1 methylglutaconyl-CoA hydratase [Prauserella sediminis]MCR3718956.1 methylglutaconyl-CoA hydratase [Prauserella flava]MCR3733526.1 methylglutaconyl-CoA hydratase [Prauserella salsuginis]
MADELVHYDLDGGVATITLDSPHNRNALSTQLRSELTDALTRAADDEQARVIVLTHTGTVFCAGMDLKEAKGAGSDDQGVNGFPAILEQLWTSPKPVVAKLAGPARAGGVGMVAAADIAVAAADATFAFTEVRIGVVPALISVTVLPRLSPRAAHELFLTGDTFDAVRAAEVGLLNAAVPADELDAKVASYVDSLVRGGPTALTATKELLHGERGRTIGAELEKMQAVSAHYFASEEGQEGIAAFGEKRPPRWIP